MASNQKLLLWMNKILPLSKDKAPPNIDVLFTLYNITEILLNMCIDVADENMEKKRKSYDISKEDFNELLKLYSKTVKFHDIN